MTLPLYYSLMGDCDWTPSSDALLFAHCLPYTDADNGGVCQCITQSTGIATVQYRDTTVAPYLLYTDRRHMDYFSLVQELECFAHSVHNFF